MLERIVLIVPPSLELVFSFTLAVTSSSVEGRNRWILVLDGLSYFLLSLTDFLAHAIPKASSSVHVFSIIDTVVAAASLLPLLFYTVFLFLFARTALISSLPTRFSRVVTFSLIAAIPPTLATNELGSLLGLTYTSLPTPPNHTPEVAVGFSTSFHQRASLFFSAACLALLTLFQALLFTVSFVRIARAFIEEHRIETASQDPQAREEIHLFRGLGWLAVGLKLGAIESVVGFANISFAVAITRRTLRFFSRGTLIIGIIKGLNIVEDITGLESDLRGRSLSARRSKLTSRRFSRFVMISNPRNSSFQQLTPEASSFHSAQVTAREKRQRTGPSPLALGSGSNMARFNGEDSKDLDFKSPGFDTPLYNIARSSEKKNQRVTVHYNGKTPPVLQLRFSAVDIDVHPIPLMPNPFDDQNNPRSPGPNHTRKQQNGGPKSAPLQPVAEDFRSDRISDEDPGWDRRLFYGGYVPKTAPLPNTNPPPRPPRDPRRASTAAPSFISDVAMPFQDRDRDPPRSSLESSTSSFFPSQRVPSPARDKSDGTLRRSVRSTSGASDSLSVVREIAARFPGLPPRVVPSKTPSRGTDPAGAQAGASGASLTSPPGLRDDVDADSDSEWRMLSRARSLKRRQEMEMEAQQASARGGSQEGGNADQDAPAGTNISPVDSIRRKPAPPFTELAADDARVEAAVSEAIITRAAVTARGVRPATSPSLDKYSSYYSSDEDDATNDGGFSYIAPSSGAGMGGQTSAPWTPATTVTVTPGFVTPGNWMGGGEERPLGRLAGRSIAASQRGDINTSSSPSAQAQAKLQYQQQQSQQGRQRQQKQQSQSQSQSQPQPQPQPAKKEGTTLEERRRMHRLTLLRRELAASAHDSATANAALEPELQAPWLHADPLTQLQTMVGSGPLLQQFEDGDDEDENDAVLDDAWRRAGLTRIKSVSRVRVHTTPRVEQGFEVRGSLVAVEEEDEDEDDDLVMSMSPVQGQGLGLGQRRSMSTSRKPARLDSGVLGEEDKMLISAGH